MNVLKNYLYNISYQLLNIILPIITVPYVTRIFTSDSLGSYGFYNSIVSYFMLFATLGISIFGTKEIARSKNKSITFWNIYIIQITVSLLSLSAYSIVVVSISKMNNIISVILMISFITKFFDISWLFAGLEDFKKITLRNAIVKVVGVISILTFIKSEDQLPLYVLFLVIFELLGQLVMWVPALKILKKPIFFKEKIKNNFRPIIMLFLPQIAISLYVVMDRTMLGIFKSFYDIGIYDQGQKLISIILTVVTSLGVVMLPRVANLLSDGREEEAINMLRFSFIIYNLIIFPTIFGMLAINDIFVSWFLGSNFQDVKYVIYIMIFKVWFIGWTNILGYQVLVARNKNKQFLLSTTIPAIVSVALNIVLIPWLGYIGLTITSVCVELLVLIIQVIYSKDVISKSILFNRSFFKIVISAMIMCGIVVCLRNIFHLGGILGLIIYITVGAISYTIMITILKVINVKEIKQLLASNGK